jgi:hypothetical protein
VLAVLAVAGAGAGPFRSSGGGARLNTGNDPPPVVRMKPWGVKTPPLAAGMKLWGVAAY